VATKVTVGCREIIREEVGDVLAEAVALSVIGMLAFLARVTGLAAIVALGVQLRQVRPQ